MQPRPIRMVIFLSSLVSLWSEVKSLIRIGSPFRAQRVSIQSDLYSLKGRSSTNFSSSRENPAMYLHSSFSLFFRYTEHLLKFRSCLTMSMIVLIARSTEVGSVRSELTRKIWDRILLSVPLAILPPLIFYRPFKKDPE